MFPVARPRRLRSRERIRNLVSETGIDIRKLIMPVFVDEAAEEPIQVASMPGIYRHTLESVVKHAEKLDGLGIENIMLFGIPARKDAEGTSAYDPEGVVQKAAKLIKGRTSLTVIADLCMCEYTTHGHCGVLTGESVNNDETLKSYGRIAASYANAGVDIIAPSGMMDGQVGYIRKILDSEGYHMIPIMAYSAKYASSMYGPFRFAADSTPSFGDRKTYQMDPANSREAMREISMDIEEGADIIMVKPALPYLDIIHRARERFDAPLAAYSVSGEYTMIRNAIDQGLLSESAIEELTGSVFRAGADMLITYFAEYLAEKLRKRS